MSLEKLKKRAVNCVRLDQKWHQPDVVPTMVQSLQPWDFRIHTFEILRGGQLVLILLKSGALCLRDLRDTSSMSIMESYPPGDYYPLDPPGLYVPQDTVDNLALLVEVSWIIGDSSERFLIRTFLGNQYWCQLWSCFATTELILYRIDHKRVSIDFIMFSGGISLNVRHYNIGFNRLAFGGEYITEEERRHLIYIVEIEETRNIERYAILHVSLAVSIPTLLQNIWASHIYTPCRYRLTSRYLSLQKINFYS